MFHSNVALAALGPRNPANASRYPGLRDPDYEAQIRRRRYFGTIIRCLLQYTNYDYFTFPNFTKNVGLFALTALKALKGSLGQGLFRALIGPSRVSVGPLRALLADASNTSSMVPHSSFYLKAVR